MPLKKSQKSCSSRINKYFYEKCIKVFITALIGFKSEKSAAQIINYVNNPSFELALPSVTLNPYDAATFWSPLNSGNCNAYYLMGKPPIGTSPYNPTGFHTLELETI